MVIVTSAESLANQVISLFDDPVHLANMGNAARDVVEANRGGLERLNSVISQML